MNDTQSYDNETENISSTEKSSIDVSKNIKASIDVNGTINALSVSPSKNLVAIGGRDGKYEY